MYTVTTTGTQQHITAHNSVQEFSDYKKAVQHFFSECNRFDDVDTPEWPETEQPLICDCRDYIVKLSKEIKEVDGYYIDCNYNKWSANVNSREEAERKSFASVGSKNCTDCIGCTDCIDCTSCINCQDCHNCFDCHNSVGLRDCSECETCEYSHKLERCKNCDRCENCKDSSNLTLCSNCEWCRGGFRTVSSVGCRDARFCDNCHYCTDINNCTSSYWCVMCDNLIGYHEKAFMVDGNKDA